MPRPTVYTVKLRSVRSDMVSFLDMLRYDGGTVLDWGYDGLDGFRVRLSSVRFTPERWQSFGLYPQVVN